MVFSGMSEGIISAAAVDQIVSVSESVIEVVGGAAVVVGVCVLQFCILFGYGTVDVGVLLVVIEVVGVTALLFVVIDVVGVALNEKGEVNAMVSLMLAGVFSTGCTCPCMGGGDHAIGG